jgi:hypothetical protein
MFERERECAEHVQVLGRERLAGPERRGPCEGVEIGKVDVEVDDRCIVVAEHGGDAVGADAIEHGNGIRSVAHEVSHGKDPVDLVPSEMKKDRIEGFDVGMNVAEYSDLQVSLWFRLMRPGSTVDESNHAEAVTRIFRDRIESENSTWSLNPQKSGKKRQAVRKSPAVDIQCEFNVAMGSNVATLENASMVVPTWAMADQFNP